MVCVCVGGVHACDVLRWHQKRQRNKMYIFWQGKWSMVGMSVFSSEHKTEDSLNRINHI